MLHAKITVLERSVGAARVAFVRKGARVALQDLAQSGSARAMLPRSAPDCPEVVFINTSGGLTSGDRLRFEVALADQTRITATTQTAERAYRATGDAAQVTVRATVGAGGHLNWLPQETILFEDCHLTRDTHIALAAGATCLLSEVVMLGRRAMGETPVRARLTDRRRVIVAGHPLWAETLRLDARALVDVASPAVLGGNAAFAVLALLGQGAEQAAAALRDLAPTPGVEWAVSGWNGRCILRAMAPDLWPLKQTLGRAIAQLSGQSLPRVWQMQGVTA